MIEHGKVAIIGIGLASMTYMAWKKSIKQRAKFTGWKKQKIEDMYYKNMDEQDVAWG